MSLVAYASSGSDSDDNPDDSEAAVTNNGLQNGDTKESFRHDSGISLCAGEQVDEHVEYPDAVGEESADNPVTDTAAVVNGDISGLGSVDDNVVNDLPVDSSHSQNVSETEASEDHTIQGRPTLSTEVGMEDKFSDSDEEDNTVGRVLTDTIPPTIASNFLGSLPEPTPVENEVKLDDDVLEEEVKPKESQVADVPKPQKKGKKKIMIPSLYQDSDEEENDDSASSKKPSSSKSGLMSLLPPPNRASASGSGRVQIPEKFIKKSNSETDTTKPINSSTQDTSVSSTTNTNTKNRFIPHILTKKPAGPKSKSLTHEAESTSGKDSSSTLTSLSAYGADSDDDDEDGGSNFFSLGSSKNKAHSTSVVDKQLEDVIVPSENSVICDGTNPSSSVDQDAPLMFGGASTSMSYPYMRSTSHPMPTPVYDKTDMSERDDEVGPTKKDGELEEASGVPQGAEYPEYEDQYCELPAPDSTATLLQDEEFLKIRGKKRKGAFEDINIVDVSCDDIVSPTDLSKNLTEEVPYQSHRKSDSNMPSAQQRRKKQITYLAFQAKERELELKNEWAQNRQTKKHAQSKYGF